MSAQFWCEKVAGKRSRHRSQLSICAFAQRHLLIVYFPVIYVNIKVTRLVVYYFLKMMHNVRINPKAAVACVVSLLVCVYLVYSWAAARSSMKSGTIRRQLDTWKQNDFVDIPQPITERAQKIKVEENRVKVVMDKTVNVRMARLPRLYIAKFGSARN